MNIPRTMKFVAWVCGVKASDLWFCESLDDSISKPISIESLILSIYSQLGLTLQEAKHVCELKDSILQNLNSRSFFPLTLSGALIYFYCKNNKKKITLKQVSDLVHVSNVAILRCLKSLRNK